jgi:hypothetical protein
MRTPSEKEIEAVLRLDARARFSHFVKRVVDSEVAWGLWKDGWALMGTSEGAQAFPLWPAREYAALHCEEEWSQHLPSEIPLADLLDELLPKLKRSGLATTVFPTATGGNATCPPEELEAALRTELEKYE